MAENLPTSNLSRVTLDEAERTWNELAQRVDRFVAAWEARGDEPLLAPFLPADPPALRHLVLVELIKVDLEYRWSWHRQPRRVEEYVQDFPELARAGVPGDLLYEEFHVRKRCGDAVRPEEFLARFPDQAAELQRLFPLEAPGLTLSLHNTGHNLDRFQAGQQLDDFDLLTLLGQGSFARVFLARQRSLQRLVALKISADRGAEARTLAQLDHPQIVRVYDQRLLPEQGLRLLYVTYLPGGDLHKAIDRLRPVTPAERTGRSLLEVLDEELRCRGEEPPAGSDVRRQLATRRWPEVVCWLGARLGAALDYAHRQGVLHRDVKPANVLLTAEGLPRLADFNVSCCSKLEGANPAAFFGGSLAYMSPEQLEACNPSHPAGPESLDGRSDLYSLGVTLWELLTGQRPFADEPLAAEWSRTLAQLTARRRAGVEPAALARLPPDCPAGLVATLLACLAPERDQRPPSGEELAWQLELCLEPKARQLLLPSAGGWQGVVGAAPVLAVLLAALVPNVLAALVNYGYNRQAIIVALPGALPVFWNVQLAINGAAFPLGLAALALVTWPVGRAVRRLRTGQAAGADSFRTVRHRCLKLGHLAAGLSLLAWLLAGLGYPLGLWAAGTRLSLSADLHFMASLVLCGLIASAYPFFAVTFLSVRAFYPVLVRSRTTRAADAGCMPGLQRLLGFYLVLAALVPLLAVLTLVLMGSENRWVLVVLSAGGVVGFSLGFLLYRAIQGDLETLGRLRPLGDGHPGLSESRDSFPARPAS